MKVKKQKNYETIKWLIAMTIFATATFIWGYNLGQLSVPAVDERIMGMNEINFDRIERNEAGQLVGEIFMTYEDDNIKIYKGQYGAN